MNGVFVRRLQDIFGNDSEAVLAYMGKEIPPVIRVNTLVVEEQEGVELLTQLGFEPKQVISGFNAYILRARTKRELTDTQEYVDGYFYIQSLASMLPVWSIAGEVQEKVKNEEDLMVLDMCAAPGSKTSQLATVMENTGQIVAYDTGRQRLYSLKSNMEQQGVANVFPQLGSSEGVWRKYGPIFDVVMLDAPCSGEGRFRSYDESSYTDWNMKKIQRLSAEQKRLLFSAVMCVKSGGVLVYSTCTFAPEENEEVVNFVLEKFEGAIDIEKISLKDLLPEILVDGITSWNDKTYNSAVTDALRVKPRDEWEGFFVCKIRRN